ncbi:MAG: class I SAM-dependent methyltransferase [Oscillospiraceae bacterium]
MFCWTDDMISFMQDAANFGSYQQELADWICEALPVVRHVCDAGCGLGFLSVRLAERFETVTAADISGQALANLHRIAAEKNVSNLEILETDMLTFAPEAPYDAMVFCLFGRMREILRVAKRCCAGEIVVVKKAFTHHRFRSSSVPLRDEVTEQAADFLRAHGVPFRLETKTFDMGQPLRSLDDAVRFLRFTARTRLARSPARRCCRGCARRETMCSPITCRRKRHWGGLRLIPRTFRRNYYDTVI